ncbi:cell wall metabolism sensor histidine kinase WalK [Arthrobacter sp. STN4]|uniref:sensor histidine kinase n=1 Tax=Arthrobacter sp. STN4 TaxID=2923276 RepID=UPI00211A1DC6|nr:HAMP domain-containing sensor histidine kinase [Arthrobacter sp. STN4]MCQ9164991.1 HAMP domain-containing histidine kinase [Arthrobacter sp. STN4]
MPLTTSARALRSAAARLARPGRWHLRTRLVAVLLALLTVICVLVGMISYSAMSVSLNSQLDSQLAQASARSHDFNLSTPSGPPGTRPDPLNARGTGAGQLNAIISGGYLVTGGILSPTGTRQQLTNNDAQLLAALPTSGTMADASLSIGNYRLQAVPLSNGGVLITGLPLGAVERTLAKLVLTIILVSLTGLIVLGLAGTMIVRRSMAPLEKLSALATRVSRLPLDAGEVALSVRVPDGASRPGTEVGNVGHAFNAMLDNVAHALQARQRSETKVRRFVADASHELRTPLTAIRGYTELLQMTETLTPDGKTSLGRVNAQSLRMGRLVEDLLTLARLDEGRPLSLRTADVTPIAMDAVSDVRVGAPGHHWAIDVPDTPVRAKCDDGQLKQVMLNLLSNAAKHTPAGTTVSTRVSQDADGSPVVTVTDDGPGIPPEFQDVIFDRFSRADTARTGTQGSTGLGLSIVAAIMEAHHGSVELASRPGATTFTVRLPAIPAGQATGPLATVPGRTMPGRTGPENTADGHPGDGHAATPSAKAFPG